MRFLVLCALLVLFTGCIKNAQLNLSNGAKSNSYSSSGSGSGSSATLKQPWCTNGSVNAMAMDGSTLYLGGTFTQVGQCLGTGFPVKMNTGVPDTTINTNTWPVVNGAINAVVSDGSGGWFIGGNFSKVGTFTRNYLAHIKSNLTVDTAFDPNPDAAIQSMARYGSTLYVGGSFTSFTSGARSRLAALNATNGNVTAFNISTDNNVTAMTIDSSGTYLYIAGPNISTVGGFGRNKIAKISTVASGILDNTFVPSTFTGTQINTLFLGDSESKLYVGGNFTVISGSSLTNLAALNISTGSIIATFLPDPNGTVRALAEDGSRLYVGGEFTVIDLNSVNFLAAVDYVNGFWDNTFDAAAGYHVYDLYHDGTNLYVAGGFLTIGYGTRKHLAMLDGYGLLDPSFDASLLAAPGATAVINKIASDGANLFIGGGSGATPYLYGNAAVDRVRLASIDTTTGQPTAWTPNVNGTVNAVLVANSKIYAGGSFTVVDAQVRNYISAFDLPSGSLSTWYPSTGANGDVYSLAENGTNIYAGGIFTIIGGFARNRIAAIDMNTAMIDSGFNISVSSTVYAAYVDKPNSMLYIGGMFSGAASVGGQTRNRIAAIDLTTPGVTAWDPNSNNPVYAITQTPAGILAGGNFTNIGGSPRNRLAQLDSVTGIATSWNPNVSSAVTAIAYDAPRNQVLIGGAFSSAGGSGRNRFAGIDLSTGLATPIQFSAFDNSILSIITYGDVAYIGGVFNLSTTGYFQRSIMGVDLNSYLPLSY